MPDYTSLGISFPIPSDEIKRAQLEAKLADDIKQTAVTATQAILIEGARAEGAAKAALAPDIAALTTRTTTQPLGSTHLDTVTTPGIYGQASSGSATFANGYPVNSQGRGVLTVTLVGGSILTQTYRATFLGQMYEREKSGATWTAWASPDPSARPALGTTHLDTVTTPGDYGQATSSNATLALGYPLANSRGLLKVGRVFGTNIGQMWWATTASRLFVRELYSGVWTGWSEIGGGGGGGTTTVHTGSHEREARTFAMRDRVGRVRTGGKGVVAIVFDHSLARFKSTVLPMLRTHGLKATLAINAGQYEAGYMHTPTNGSTTWGEIAGWATNDGIEIANHGWTHRGATGTQAMRRELVDSANELEAQLGVKVDTYVQIGIPGGDPNFDGFAGGPTYAAYWETEAGRMIMDRHPVVMGMIPHTWQTYRADGHMPVGVNGRWIDDGLTATFDTIKSRIDRAVTRGEKFIVRCHPYALDSALSTAALDGFLAYLKGRVTAGEIIVTTMREWAVAED